jgi:CDP-paratose 2-epimerase
MIPVDHHWLNLIRGYGALEFIDIVAIHGFPGMWWSDAPNWDWYSHWRGWTDKVSYIARHTEGRPIWITETGLATWSLERHQEDYLDLQSRCLRAAADAPAERVYWYSLEDLDPKRSAIEGFHVDENEYHMGLVRYQGRPKPAFATAQGLVTQAADTAASAHRSKSRSPTTSPSSRSRTVDG